MPVSLRLCASDARSASRRRRPGRPPAAPTSKLADTRAALLRSAQERVKFHTSGGLATEGVNPVLLDPPFSECQRSVVGSVVKKRRKRMSKKKHRKMLKRTRVQRRRLGK